MDGPVAAIRLEPGATAVTSPIVETTAGRIRGSTSDGVHSFLGIPYGEDTAGHRRFRPPVARREWSGVVDATHFGPSCPPTLTTADRAYFPTSPLWLEYAGIDASMRFSEDCLRLNVWTASLEEGDRRPVVVWLHGGGFAWGSGSSPLNAGDALARRHGLVVASVNHRLGVLGYLDLEAVAGDEWRGAGVAGLLDLALALEWLRANAAAFGGDPGNVTVIGHSGGGAKVSNLLGMPSARGLFQRVAIQSGVVSLRAMTREESEATASDLLARAGLDARSATQLQQHDPERLTGIASDLRFRPVCDGSALPVHPFDPCAAPSAEGVPLLIGTTKDDAATFKFDSDPAFAALDARGLRDRVANHPGAGFGERADDVIAYFTELSPAATHAEILVQIATATARERASLVAERQLATGADVYMYEFNYDVPMPAETAFPGRLMAPHAVELPFVFDITDRTALAGPRPERLELASHMSARWAAFARTGSPVVSNNGPEWPAWNPERRAMLRFDVELNLEADPHRAERELLAELRPDQRVLVTGRP